MSPEQKSGGKYDEKVDMYALGVILFELNCPFRTTFEKSKVRTITSKEKKTTYLYCRAVRALLCRDQTGNLFRRGA